MRQCERHSFLPEFLGDAMIAEGKVVDTFEWTIRSDFCLAASWLCNLWKVLNHPIH